VYRFLLTPRWIALHAVTLAVLVGFVILGWWQLGVYRDSSESQQIRDRPPAPIAELAAPNTPLGAAEGRQVTATGHYVAGQQLLLPGRVHDGVLGAYVVTPLRTDDGLTVAVLRGWLDDPDTTLARPPAGVVRVTGYLLAPETADDATVREGRPFEAGQAAYLAPDELAERGGPPPATTPRGYVLLREQTPASAAGPTALDVDAVAPIRDVSPWQNLSYWAQWWVFALAAVVFWASVVRSGIRTRRKEQHEPSDDGVSAPAPSHAPS
jgi:cytochrome oxidase assembly protein ShyY1